MHDFQKEKQGQALKKFWDLTLKSGRIEKREKGYFSLISQCRKQTNITLWLWIEV
jgi:hypothetical protein